MSATGSLFLGLAIGIAGTITAEFFFFRKSAKKVSRVISVLGDESLNTEQKLSNIGAIIIGK